MASRHVTKAIARAASVVVESLERRQLLAYSPQNNVTGPAGTGERV